MTTIFSKNDRGNALLFSLLGAGALAGALLLVTSNTQVSEQTRYVARIKAIQTLTELRLKTALMQPAFYSGCNSATGSSSCSIVPSKLNPFRLIRVPGAKCPPGASCGIVLENDAFDAATRVFTGTLRYHGEKVSIAPVQIRVDVPEEILQTQSYDCGALNAATPIFAGYDSAGKPICRGFGSCGDGQFVSGVNPTTLAPICTALPTSASCSVSQFISGLKWDGGSSIQVTCTPRKDPFVLWPI